MNYKYESLAQNILNNIYVDKSSNNLSVAILDKDITIYPLNPEYNDGPDILKDVQKAFLLFLNSYLQNDNFDSFNLRRNLEKNLVVGIELNDIYILMLVLFYTMKIEA